MAVLQVRVDDELKNQAAAIYNELGIDLSTAIRMFLKRTVIEKGIPFETTIDESSLEMSRIVKGLQKHSEEIGNSEMTLDEINEIIRLVRERRRKRNGNK